MGPPRWAMVAAVALAVGSGRLCSAEGEGEVAIPQMPPAGEPIALSDETFEQLAGQTEIMVRQTPLPLSLFPSLLFPPTARSTASLQPVLFQSTAGKSST
jgi:hypothetical protein